VVVDAKTDYPAVCNAVETLLLHQDHPADSVQNILESLHAAGVELRVCEATRAEFCNGLEIPFNDAADEDWVTEYTDLILSVKTVPNLETAIQHINSCGSHHTDAIVTEHTGHAQEFLHRVDSAGVFWNASTRFADGFRYGFGAEVGVSTCRTHARGPVGLEGLVIHKYLLYGSGQGAGDYGVGKKEFRHEPLPHTLPELDL
jgi:glutamate-5-semialdehyde dehydrogenase